MKKILFAAIFTLFAFQVAQAQKFGYVDTEQILNQLDEYKAAQTEIDQQSERWQKELEEMYAEVERLYADYQAQKVLLPEDVLKQKEEEIVEAERRAQEFKKKKFGYDGELYKLQDQKIRPIQDKVYAAIEAVAKEKKLDFILDKAANSGILYTNGIYDRTQDVLAKLNVQ